MRIEELPGGRGLSDVVFLPTNGSSDPALVIELKWNETDEAAISQIKIKNYPAVLKEYHGKVILVGINYSPETVKHSCKIERINR